MVRNANETLLEANLEADKQLQELIEFQKEMGLEVPKVLMQPKLSEIGAKIVRKEERKRRREAKLRKKELMKKRTEEGKDGEERKEGEEEQKDNESQKSSDLSTISESSAAES